MRRQALHIADVTKTTYNRDVYEPSDDSFALVDALQQELVKIPLSSACQCLEIGSGSGYVSCSLALLLRHCNVSASCIATDISVHAVTATKATVAAHQVTEVDVIQADLVSPLSARLQQAVDILVFNPPYVPTPDEEVAKGGIAAAWAGGNCGRVVIDRVLPLVDKLLSRGGHFFMVTVPENKPEEILALLSKNGLQGTPTWSCAPAVRSITSFLLIAEMFEVFGVRRLAAPASIGLPTFCHQGTVFITTQSLLQQIMPCVIHVAQAICILII
ncbi:hypothetical protein ABBQ38_005854 [Trebouxia sp. C0009 RCD-2024]